MVGITPPSAGAAKLDPGDRLLHRKRHGRVAQDAAWGHRRLSGMMR